MKKLGYIYAVILYAFRKKISVEEALEMIRAKILEPDEETMPKQIKPHKKGRWHSHKTSKNGSFSLKTSKSRFLGIN